MTALPLPARPQLRCGCRYGDSGGAGGPGQGHGPVCGRCGRGLLPVPAGQPHPGGHLNRISPALYQELKGRLKPAAVSGSSATCRRNRSSPWQAATWGFCSRRRWPVCGRSCSAWRPGWRRPWTWRDCSLWQAVRPVWQAVDQTSRRGSRCAWPWPRMRRFAFYYRENLSSSRTWGAELVPFSPLRDRKLPEGVSGLLLGGGYPELHGEALEENQVLREEIRRRRTRPTHRGRVRRLPVSPDGSGGSGGRPAFHGGVLPGKAWYTGKLRRFGYLTLKARGRACTALPGRSFRGHEFHYFDTGGSGRGF